MFAAKEKTFSPSSESTFTWSPRGTYVQAAATSKHHQPITTRSAEQVVSSFTLNDFIAFKSEKSPIGSKVKSRPKSPWPSRRSPEKTLGETRLQLRQTHWAIEMSQYRAYFVPSGVDPLGLDKGLVGVQVGRKAITLPPGNGGSATYGWYGALDHVVPVLHFTVSGSLDSSGCNTCLLYTSPSPRDQRGSRMPSSA